MALKEIKNKHVAAVLLVFLAGFLSGSLVFGGIPGKNFQTEVTPIRENASGYKFIHPLLAYDVPEEEGKEYTALKEKLNNLIKDKIKNGQLDSASVYFRAQGRWIGINEDEPYEPASLLKVAIMMAYFKLSETGTVNLNDKLVYKGGPPVPFETPSELAENKSYTIEELINYLIVKSDNGAKDTLLANIDEKVLNSVYVSFGIEHPSDTTAYQISAKNYALFLRILFNATYLNRDLSEKALELLSKAEFKDGLVAGVPQGVTVAHKFGEKVNDDGRGNITNLELHDCGIIYMDKNNYLLCVMTKGQKRGELVSAIKEVSSTVYADLAKNLQ